MVQSNSATGIQSTSAPLSEDSLRAEINYLCSSLPRIKRALVIHPDYSRHDFTHLVAPLLYECLESRGLVLLDTINAGGTHRAMSDSELEKKLGLSSASHPLVGRMINHAFDDPNQLVIAAELDPEFINEKTNGNLSTHLRVDVNKIVTQNYDAIFAISGTVPHEALGYSGGTKIFFPGISGPEVIAMLHWAAVLMGIPQIIGTVDNPARDVVNAGTSKIFDLIGNIPIVSLNMVYTEDSCHQVVPNGLFIGTGFQGFLDAHRQASELSSHLHIVYLDTAKRRVVQKLPEMYDEIWTAGKGSYKLQRPGVLEPGAEIILYAPHIDCFHSNSRMDSDLRKIGYHGLEHVLNYCRENPGFDKNIASHVINVKGFGEYRNGNEEFPFSVTLATQISEADCRAVNLGYRDPKTITESNFSQPGDLWIPDGGQWLYARR